MKNALIISKELEKKQADAWVLVDYENRNPSVPYFVGKRMLTRKIIFVFEKDKAYIICHTIDTVFLNDPEITKDFELRIYKTWQEMLDIEKELLKGFKRVLMDISEDGLLPRVSLADFGSVDFVKKQGIDVISSADLLQTINAAYDDESYALQLKACETTLKIKDEAFQKIGELISRNGEADEFEIQQFICNRFHEEGMIYDDEAIVAVGPNASNPHYGPTAKKSSKIHEGDLVLIDMWAKYDNPKGVYADITWMAFIGDEVPEEMNRRFNILKTAIDKGFKFIEDTSKKRPVMGYEVDRVVRDYIESEGYGEYFTHRTGHNISVDISPHGPGANIDDYESHDTRQLIDGTTFSMEPGIYVPDYGMRSETNVAMRNGKPTFVAGRQKEITKITIK